MKRLSFLFWSIYLSGLLLRSPATFASFEEMIVIGTNMSKICQTAIVDISKGLIKSIGPSFNSTDIAIAENSAGKTIFFYLDGRDKTLRISEALPPFNPVGVRSTYTYSDMGIELVGTGPGPDRIHTLNSQGGISEVKTDGSQTILLPPGTPNLKYGLPVTVQPEASQNLMIATSTHFFLAAHPYNLTTSVFPHQVAGTIRTVSGFHYGILKINNLFVMNDKAWLHISQASSNPHADEYLLRLDTPNGNLRDGVQYPPQSQVLGMTPNGDLWFRDGNALYQLEWTGSRVKIIDVDFFNIATKIPNLRLALPNAVNFHFRLPNAFEREVVRKYLNSKASGGPMSSGAAEVALRKAMEFDGVDPKYKDKIPHSAFVNFLNSNFSDVPVWLAKLDPNLLKRFGLEVVKLRPCRFRALQGNFEIEIASLGAEMDKVSKP